MPQLSSPYSHYVSASPMLQVVSQADVNSQLSVVAQAGGAAVAGYGAPASKLQRSDRIEVSLSFFLCCCVSLVLVCLLPCRNVSLSCVQSAANRASAEPTSWCSWLNPFAIEFVLQVTPYFLRRLSFIYFLFYKTSCLSPHSLFLLLFFILFLSLIPQVGWFLLNFDLLVALFRLLFVSSFYIVSIAFADVIRPTSQLLLVLFD